MECAVQAVVLQGQGERGWRGRAVQEGGAVEALSVQVTGREEGGCSTSRGKSLHSQPAGSLWRRGEGGGGAMHLGGNFVQGQNDATVQLVDPQPPRPYMIQKGNGSTGSCLDAGTCPFRRARDNCNQCCLH